jgi:Fe-S-cluster-containing hydrogenase component 2
MDRIIHIRADAPLKPALGAACNGCGVCCLAEPCPVGMLFSRKRQGACDVLRWDEAQARYRCGLLVSPKTFVRPAWLARLAARLARRVIAAGQGCDSDMALEDADRALR